MLIHIFQIYLLLSLSFWVSKLSNGQEIIPVLCAIALQEELYLDEWITYHQMLGFAYIIIYDNSDEHNLKYLPSAYHGRVSLGHLPGLGKQLDAYKQCFEQLNNHQTTAADGTEREVWAAVLDVDEFLVLEKHESVGKLIEQFVSTYGPNAGSLSLNWRIFGSNGFANYSSEPILDRFTRRAQQLDGNRKYLSRVRDTLAPDIHWPTLVQGKQVLDWSGVEVTPFSPLPSCPGRVQCEVVAAVNHYFVKSREEFQRKLTRGKADSVYRNEQTGETLSVLGPARRSPSDFAKHDLNEVEDFLARDFYRRGLKLAGLGENSAETGSSGDGMEQEFLNLFYDTKDPLSNPPQNPITPSLDIQIPISLRYEHLPTESTVTFETMVTTQRGFERVPQSLTGFCVDHRLQLTHCLQILPHVLQSLQRQLELNFKEPPVSVGQLNFSGMSLIYALHEQQGPSPLVKTLRQAMLSGEGSRIELISSEWVAHNRVTYVLSVGDDDMQLSDDLSEPHTQEVRVRPTPFRESVFFRDFLPFELLSDRWTTIEFVTVITRHALSRHQWLHDRRLATGLNSRGEQHRLLGVLQNAFFDVVPLFRSTGGLLLSATFSHSRRFKLAWDLLLQALGFSEEEITQSYSLKPFYGHSFIARTQWMERLSVFMSEAMDVCLFNETVRSALGDQNWIRVNSTLIPETAGSSTDWGLAAAVTEVLPAFFFSVRGAKVCAVDWLCVPMSP